MFCGFYRLYTMFNEVPVHKLRTEVNDSSYRYVRGQCRESIVHANSLVVLLTLTRRQVQWTSTLEMHINNTQSCYDYQ